ncbi:hypothetical protein HHI36_016111 [Cryptolaemus montrouzieri]|uniref:Uncharacterized protein n=1 Tax=Cryptolaemus montrouzieri TaxID=559131 RepID=A0ABD2NIK9_9CUCU
MGLLENWNEYKKRRNEYVNLLKTKKKDPYKMWKALKSIVNLKNISDCFGRGIEFEIDGVIVNVTDKHDFTKKFNKYFVNSINENVDSINARPTFGVNGNVLLHFVKSLLLYEKFLHALKPV